MTQEVHFAPWQVSQTTSETAESTGSQRLYLLEGNHSEATFDYGLLEALKANGCIY
jgi:hypothetical protein